MGFRPSGGTSWAMNSTQLLIFIAIIIALLAFRIYRSTREQRWHIQQMWILPAIFLVITIGYVALDTAQYRLAPLAAVVGLAAGLAVGMYQGNHTTLRI